VGAGTLGKFLKNMKTTSNPNILVGFDTADDACVYKINDSTAVIQTVDFFPPIVDDPYMFGQIAAANALSDIYAMGGTPSIALNIMCVSDKLPEEVVAEILRGGSDKVTEAGATITGGHTIKSQEPIYGLSVMGFVEPDKILKNSTAVSGNSLILTKPLGIGLITTAAKAEIASEDAKQKAQLSMSTLNKTARDIMVKYHVSSCTDITGFGLAGHSMEMADGSNLTIELFSESIPFFSEAREYASMGLIPAGSYRNREYVKGKINISPDSPASKDPFYEDIIYDPQTSGGLLIAISEADAQNCLKEMKAAGIPAALIGKTTDRKNFSIALS